MGTDSHRSRGNSKEISTQRSNTFDLPHRAWVDQLQHYTVETLQHCIETDLSLIETFIHLSEERYQRGSQENGDRAIAEAKRGIEHIRNFISKTDLLSPEWRETVARRCHELELRIIATPSR